MKIIKNLVNILICIKFGMLRAGFSIKNCPRGSKIMSVVINFKTDPEIKKEAQRIAREMGISLGAILNMYLRIIVREKS